MFIKREKKEELCQRDLSINNIGMFDALVTNPGTSYVNLLIVHK